MNKPNPESPSDEQDVGMAKVAARVPTADEAMLIEFAKRVMLDSSERAIEFHKTMLGVSATFGTLLASLAPILIWGSKDAILPPAEGWLLVIPPILMLGAAVCFALGFFPRRARLNPDIPEEVRRFRSDALKHRGRLAFIGTALFAVSILSTVILALILRNMVTV